MKFYCIADEDTVRGFRLAGIEAYVAADADQAISAISIAISKPDLGIIIITEHVASWIRSQIDTFRINRDRPLIVEIPGPEGPLSGRKSLREFVQEAVGVSVG